jgi:phosphoribosylformylglycinamidine cyclo-ligase
VPPLFKLIQEQSNTSWKEMYQVFNMGHRMELYLKRDVASDVIKIAKSFDLNAQVIGFVEKSPRKKLTIHSPEGKLIY